MWPLSGIYAISRRVDLSFGRKDGKIRTMSLLLQELIVGLSTGAIYALIALGYTMVYGIIELINFAHGDIFMIGTFVCIAIFGLFGISNSSQPVGLTLIAALVLAFLLSTLVCAV